MVVMGPFYVEGVASDDSAGKLRLPVQHMTAPMYAVVGIQKIAVWIRRECPVADNTDKMPKVVLDGIKIVHLHVGGKSIERIRHQERLWSRVEGVGNRGGRK